MTRCDIDLSAMPTDEVRRWIRQHLDALEGAKAVVSSTERLATDPAATDREVEALRAARAAHLALHNAFYFPFNSALIDQLRAADTRAIETAVCFLELDPWFVGTGHLKDSLARRLAQLQLEPEHVRRLQRVLCAVVDRKAGWEFRAYTRLARRRLDSPELREQMSARLAHHDEGVRLRAQWVLDALTRNERPARE